MTRIHYNAIAKALKDNALGIRYDKMVDLVNDLCVIFEADDDRFDSDIFKKASGL